MIRWGPCAKYFPSEQFTKQPGAPISIISVVRVSAAADSSTAAPGNDGANQC